MCGTPLIKTKYTNLFWEKLTDEDKLEYIEKTINPVEEYPVVEKEEDTEYRILCNICGKVFCYTDSDLKQLNREKTTAAVGAVATALNAFSGHMTTALLTQNVSSNAQGNYIDLKRCRYCNSRSITTYTDKEWDEKFGIATFVGKVQNITEGKE